MLLFKGKIRTRTEALAVALTRSPTLMKGGEDKKTGGKVTLWQLFQ